MRTDGSFHARSSQFLGDLFAGGFLDSPFRPFDQNDSYIPYFEWFLGIAKNKKVWSDYRTFDLWTASQSTRWQESTFGAFTHQTVTDYWAVELAQFVVPEGHIGWVKSIEQVVNDVRGGYYPTNQFYWGSPVFVDPDVSNLRWYLKLSYFDGRLPARYNLSSTVPIPAHALPGEPYPPLPEIDALWYPAHNARPMKLPVPGQSVLRLYLVTPPCVTWQWQVAAKLAGNTQSADQVEAVQNARKV